MGVPLRIIPFHSVRLFQCNTVAGMPVSDVARNCRLTKAAAFLKEGFGSSESAYKAGFDSPAYFTKCFRAFYGLTPSDLSFRNYNI